MSSSSLSSAARAAVVAVIACGIAAPAVAADTAPPSWMTVDAASKTVHFAIQMAENGNNGTLNFNGYAHGAMTITVPLGWNVKMKVTNAGAGAIPHSLEIIAQSETTPPQGVEPPIFDGAETINLINGLGVGQSDEVDFVAATAGHYWMFCGVPDHGVGGMWDNFVVSTAVTAPSVAFSSGS
jgi:sulfocyanin